MHKWSIPILFLVVLAGCGQKAFFDEYQDIPGKSWKHKDAVSFAVAVEDTTQPMNIVLRFRHSSDYPYQNLFIFLNTQYPDGKQSLDTLDFYLLDDRGKPLGECSGDICEAKFQIRKNITFPQAGEYIFRVYHNMRTEEEALPGITDVGLRIEKTN